jgi:hypothetical protein
MFDRLARSWRLVKASASVLRQDKELLVFPLISVASLLLLLVAFAVPVIVTGGLEGLHGRHGGDLPPAAYLVAFLFYFSQYFVIFYFNAALVGAAMMRLDGGDPGVGDGLRIATSRIGAIAGYAFIAATVGMILRAIQERVGFIGKVIVGLLGVGWTIATYMVVPVLVSKNVGPIDAIKESAGLLKKTWGENVIGQVGLSAAFVFIFFFVVLAGLVVVGLAFATKSIAAIVLALLILVLAIAVTALVQSALAGIYAAALYRYATTGKGSAAFDEEALKGAFAPR